MSLKKEFTYGYKFFLADTCKGDATMHALTLGSSKTNLVHLISLISESPRTGRAARQHIACAAHRVSFCYGFLQPDRGPEPRNREHGE